MTTIRVPITIEIAIEADPDGIIRYADTIGGARLGKAAAAQHTPEALAALVAKATGPRTDDGLVRVESGGWTTQLDHLRYLRGTPTQIVLACGAGERRYRRRDGRGMGGGGARCNLDDVRAIEAAREESGR